MPKKKETMVGCQKKNGRKPQKERMQQDNGTTRQW